MKAYNSKYLGYKLKSSLRKQTPRWLVLMIDVYITINTFLLVFLLLRLIDMKFNQHELYDMLIYQAPQVLVLSLLAFLVTAPYKGIIRHTGFSDVVNVFKANLLYLFFIGTFSVFASYNLAPAFKIGKTTILLHFLINTIVLVFLRILYKNFYEKYIVGAIITKRVMIYGAGTSGIITYDAIEKDIRGGAVVYGFIDDNKHKAGKRINGIRVYDPSVIDNLFIEKHGIEEVIISIQRIKPDRLKEIVDQFSDSAVTLKIVPPVSDWLNDNLTTQQIKEIRIEDLLGREPIELEKEEIRNEIHGKTVLITGAAGSIGSEIARQLMGYPCKRLILLDQAETALFELEQTTKKLCRGNCEFIMADIRNEERTESVIKFYKPDFIFHAAAYKHVPLMEDNPYEAVQANVKGTQILSELAVKYDVEKFVMVSTDKAVNPTNVMGATKRVAELYVTHLNERSKTRFIVTRFGNVLGSNGSVIPIFKRQLAQGGPLTVTHREITRYFMTIPEACQLVLEAGAMGKGGEVFVFDMGESIKIFDLAKRIIRLSGLKYPDDINIEIVGLRPGEKLKEELLADNETSIKTHHPKIMIARVAGVKPGFDDKIKELIYCPMTDEPAKNKMKLVSIIKTIVPEYKSENSIYCSIDESGKQPLPL